MGSLKIFILTSALLLPLATSSLAGKLDGRLTLILSNGREQPIAVDRCTTAKCVLQAGPAKALLIKWRRAASLKIRITETSGHVTHLEWPLVSMSEIIDILAKQRQIRGLP